MKNSDISASNSVGQLNQSAKQRNKNRMTISITRKTPHSHSHTSHSTLCSQKQRQKQLSMKTQLMKLFDISQRCQKYFDKYLEDHKDQIDYTNIMFEQLFQFLEESFSSLVDCIEKKKREMRVSISQKKQDFLQIQDRHYEQISSILAEVKIREIQCEQKKVINDSHLSNFACVLNTFYEKIEEIQSVKYRENIRESINFIHRLIEDESSSGFLSDNIGQTQIETPASISFNNEQLFEIQNLHSAEQKDYRWNQFKTQTQLSQRSRENRLRKYGTTTGRKNELFLLQINK